MVHIYGIPNCDSVKKALNWLQLHNVPFTFHDFKKESVSPTKLEKWCSVLGWQTLFNNRSSTWKKLQKDDENLMLNKALAIELMMEHTSIIKRPVLEIKDKILTGFKENDYIETILN